MKINRKAALLGGLGSSLGGLLAAAQQDVTFFRIGTGGTIGTYFPVGGRIANAISNPPGSRPAPTAADVACLTLLARRLPRTVRLPMSPV
jgi:TRAP-type uncharacterized transport system substrate-binding protein